MQFRSNFFKNLQILCHLLRSAEVSRWQPFTGTTAKFAHYIAWFRIFNRQHFTIFKQKCKIFLDLCNQTKGCPRPILHTWVGLKWQSNVFYIRRQGFIIFTKPHHLIYTLIWCWLTLFMSSKLLRSQQAESHSFSTNFSL